MKKIIAISLIIYLITACQKESNNQTLETKFETDNQIIETKDTNEEILSKESEMPLENIVEEKYNPSNNEPIQEIIEKPKIVIESNNESANNQNEDDSVDRESIDYIIHKGRIDCDSETSCMDKSIPIQFKYKKSIANVFYLEVVSKKDKILGYFIEYNFKDNKYNSLEECDIIGKEIKDTLSDRVIGYECYNEGILKIKTDYGKE